MTFFWTFKLSNLIHLKFRQIEVCNSKNMIKKYSKFIDD